MSRQIALLVTVFSVVVAGCGGSGAKPVSLGELQATLARHGLHTFVVYDRQQSHLPSVRAYSVYVPALVRNFPRKCFVPAAAVIADQRPSQDGSLPRAVQVEAYLFSTDAVAESAAQSCSPCLAAHNIVVAAIPAARRKVKTALSELK